jgi:hypothetical protein
MTPRVQTIEPIRATCVSSSHVHLIIGLYLCPISPKWSIAQTASTYRVPSQSAAVASRLNLTLAPDNSLSLRILKPFPYSPLRNPMNPRTIANRVRLSCDMPLASADLLDHF